EAADGAAIHRHRLVTPGYLLGLIELQGAGAGERGIVGVRERAAAVELGAAAAGDGDWIVVGEAYPRPDIEVAAGGLHEARDIDGGAGKGGAAAGDIDRSSSQCRPVRAREAEAAGVDLKPVAEGQRTPAARKRYGSAGAVDLQRIGRDGARNRDRI